MLINVDSTRMQLIANKYYSLQVQEIVTRRPVVTKVSNSANEGLERQHSSSSADSDDDPDETEHPTISELPPSSDVTRTENEIKDLSVHSFIDSLVSQITTKPDEQKQQETDSPPNFPLRTSTDLNLDQLISLLEDSPDIEFESKSSLLNIP